MLLNLDIRTAGSVWRLAVESQPSRLDPDKMWVFFGHDYQIGGWWNEGDIDRAGFNRVYPGIKGRPETVATYEKEKRVNLSPEFDWFNKDLFLLSAFKEVVRSRFTEIQAYFDFVMADNRVITNNATYPNGYMPLAMGGNIGHVIGEDYFPNFGPCWRVEALNASKAPPDVEDVFWRRPWLWSKATITRYARPEENIQGLYNPWQHVTPFTHKAWPGGCHVPLMLISSTGYVHVPKGRCIIITDGRVPDPYNPALGWQL